MRPISKTAATVVLGLAVLTSACSDTDLPTQPVTPEPQAGLLGDLVDTVVDAVEDLVGTEVEVLRRTVPLEDDVVVSKVIGRRGGSIHLPEAGLSVYFPRYAVRRSTEITVVAPAGDLVGYHFEPHGLEFRRDVIAVQDLTHTDASLLDRLLGTELFAAYFEGELNPLVTALEVLDLNLLALGRSYFEIEHFSGYVIATN